MVQTADPNAYFKTNTISISSKLSHLPNTGLCFNFDHFNYCLYFQRRFEYFSQSLSKLFEWKKYSKNWTFVYELGFLIGSNLASWYILNMDRIRFFFWFDKSLFSVLHFYIGKIKENTVRYMVE